MQLRAVRVTIAPGKTTDYWAWAREIVALWDEHGIVRAGGPYALKGPDGEDVALWLSLHHPADEPGDRGIEDRDEELDREQREKQPLRLAREMPIEGDQPGRRLRPLGHRGRGDDLLEKGKHRRQQFRKRQHTPSCPRLSRAFAS